MKPLMRIVSHGVAKIFETDHGVGTSHHARLRLSGCEIRVTKASLASESNADSSSAASPAAHPRSAENAKIRSASPAVIAGRRPDVPVFHYEGGIAIVVFVNLLNDGSANLADERHPRPRRQGCWIEFLVKSQHSPLRPRAVRRRLLTCR
jgi:hypothetical protein